MERENHGALTFLGVVMILYGLTYAILGTLSLAGTITGVLPGHEKQEFIVVVLSYIITLISLIGGIASMRGKYKTAKTIGIIFAIVGLASLISNQLTQDMFNSFDCIAMVLGTGIFYLASVAEIRQKALEKAKERQKKKQKKEKETTKKEVSKKPTTKKATAKKTTTKKTKTNKKEK